MTEAEHGRLCDLTDLAIRGERAVVYAPTMERARSEFRMLCDLMKLFDLPYGMRRRGPYGYEVMVGDARDCGVVRFTTRAADMIAGWGPTCDYEMEW